MIEYFIAAVVGMAVGFGFGVLMSCCIILLDKLRSLFLRHIK